MIAKENMQDVIAGIMKKIREDEKLSCKSMSIKVGVDDKTWKRWEDGTTNPTCAQFFEACVAVGKNPIQELYNAFYIEPNAFTNMEQMRQAAADYFLYVAPDLDVQEFGFLASELHGSEGHAIMQMITALYHLPMDYRVLIAKNVMSMYQIAEGRDEIICPDEVMPDFDILIEAIRKGHKAATERKNSYTTIYDDNQNVAE